MPKHSSVSRPLEGVVMAALSDSPKKQTGFGTVVAELYKGFHDAGAILTAYGFLDHEPDDKKILPYNFRPTPYLDDLAHQTYGFFLRQIKPDVIFMLTDPGNIMMYVHGIVNAGQATYSKDGKDFIPPVVAYTPIEGRPSPLSHGDALSLVQYLNGHVVVYCHSAREAIQEQFPTITPSVVNHGLDHAPFQKYCAEDRKILRELVGLDDKFVIGSVGVNKRTKGFPTMIYTAAYLRSIGQDNGIVFYTHTNPYEETMWGYKLVEMTEYYKVRDMFIFKPDIRERYWDGVERDNGTLEQARKLKGLTPDIPERRGFVFGHYDFIARMNCFDLYVDASQIEGWGLGVGEAMACGVPVISVHDKHVRDEVYGEGAYMIDPLPPELWDTWHTGMRLVTINPVDLAHAIMKMRDNPEMREEYSRRGMEVASRYKWDDAREMMVEIVRMTVERDRREVAEMSK